MVAALAAQRDELGRLERLAAWRDLARKLAHEIKNPLTPIQLAMHQATDRAALRGGEDARLARECREIVDEEIDRLRRFVREFSEFARLPAPEIVPGDVGELVRTERCRPGVRGWPGFAHVFDCSRTDEL